jgi:hypothetical protein
MFYYEQASSMSSLLAIAYDFASINEELVQINYNIYNIQILSMQIISLKKRATKRIQIFRSKESLFQLYKINFKIDSTLADILKSIFL